jgi:hypothetical protein
MGTDMATTDAPFGFQPYGNILSANIYAVVTSNATAAFVGDLMEAVGTAITTSKFGTIQAAITEETGAAGSLLGACLACFDEDMMPCTSIAASETGDGTVAGYVLVADHPNQLYIAQEDGDTSSLQVADIGNNVDAVSTASGSTTTGLSGMEIDSDTQNTTATLAFKLLGVHPDDTISSAGAAGNHARFIVKMNSAYMGSNTSGI